MADEATPTIPTFKKRGAKANFRKRAATPPPQSDSDSFTSSEDESGRKVKRRRQNAVLKASTADQKAKPTDLTTTRFVANASTSITQTNDATRQSNWYDEKDPDALDADSLLGKTREKRADNQSLDGTYKGASGYQSFIQKNPNAPSRQVGPLKAPTNIRTITITDFAPDVCKDYKQTGFCGFGDSCKFLHAREDYKQGWALDRDWEISTKGKKQEGKIVSSANRGEIPDGEEDEEEAKLLEKIPFACIICKEPYKSPIITKCSHYFCEACALKRYRKNPNCAACGAGTGGVFNTAKNLKKLLDKKKAREEKLANAENEDENPE